MEPLESQNSAEVDIREQARHEAARFIEENQLLLQSLCGLRGVTIKVGTGFATNPLNGEVTVDPSFYLEDDYKPEWCTYGTVHELVAHVREIFTEPELTVEKNKFYDLGKEFHIFANVFDDIVGNNRIHQLLPSMRDVAADVYRERQTKNNDYRDFPRHLQLLYGLLRESMVPDGDTVVSDEVMAVISSLRSFGSSQEDAIAYVSNPNVSASKRWRVLQKVIWPAYEKLLEKDIEDKENEESKQENSQSDNSSSQSQGDQGENQQESGDNAESDNSSNDGKEQGAQNDSNNQGEQDSSGKQNEDDQKGEGSSDNQQESGDNAESGDDSNKSQDQSNDSSQGGQGSESAEVDSASEGQGNGSGEGSNSGEHKHSHGRKSVRKTKAGDKFDEDYNEYWDSHPEILTEEQEKDLEEFIKTLIEQGRAEIEQDPGNDINESNSPQSRNDKKPKDETYDDNVIKALEISTGVPYEVILAYRENLDRLWPIIEDMEEFFNLIIGERLTSVFAQHRYLDEGEINGEQMAELVANVTAGNDPGSVYKDISEEFMIAPDSGGFDFYLLIDRSGSMKGDKAKMATDSVMAIVEGLASCHRKVIETQQAFGVELGLDVATSVILFDEEIETVKSIGEQLSEQERMAIFLRTQQADGGTRDFIALEEVGRQIDELEGNDYKERKKVVIVVTDGISNSPDRTKSTVENLRKKGSVVVFGIGIGSDAATSVYSPDGKRINSLNDLSPTLVELIKKQIQEGVLLQRPVRN